MGLLSSSVSITRYKVEGRLPEPIIETVATGLKKNTLIDIDNEAFESAIGWTSFDTPFNPNFEGSSFVVGPHFFFSMRMDKKNISAKVVKKMYTQQMAKTLAESGREYLSREEKRLIKDAVIQTLYLRIPATPNVYDLIWKYEDAELWFFSHQKAANEALETLFSKSFRLTLIRLFPYTAAMLTAGLSEAHLDSLSSLSPTSFTG
jgi:recombination associated protein RdgC